MGSFLSFFHSKSTAANLPDCHNNKLIKYWSSRSWNSSQMCTDVLFSFFLSAHPKNASGTNGPIYRYFFHPCVGRAINLLLGNLSHATAAILEWPPEESQRRQWELWHFPLKVDERHLFTRHEMTKFSPSFLWRHWNLQYGRRWSFQYGRHWHR